MVRHDEPDNVEQPSLVNRLPSLPPAPDDGEQLPDWRELGRHVLGESLRRTARALRRRNACRVYPSRFRGKWRGSP